MRLILAAGFAITALGTLAHAKEPWQWETVEATGKPTARHEAALAAFDGKVYLIGGRRINPVDVFDPVTATWSAKSSTPMELHHFQAVVWGQGVYLIGAMTGGYPRETPLDKIIVYSPATDSFQFVHGIPESRRRGGAGAVVHDDKIYLVGGITNGHVGGSTAWLDCYDPRTGDWEVLEDAPHARDHFQAVLIGDKIYAAGGRTTSQATKQTFQLTVPEVDVYDIRTGRWQTSATPPPLPVARAGNMAMTFGGALIIGGGESGDQKTAHDEVEVWSPGDDTWKRWPSLQRGRHGSGFAIVGDHVYTASGSGNRGGGPELESVERLALPRQ
ncbi:N-acetylneuraminate epimerase [Rubripirellula lacrimiformis]|uniref:N-acetylneuraminate epimerase n=1 Tax=Rubripirellula lacrimiformis TaxID=1930273 RepID=A0A517NC63_9BACT|nr:kelch repeat-containing protein [Rubripirellula lacrimiformis]QDT04720.1 N-acetylneuraminate epimerase [Rubripirellula lacrimiformis]